MKKLYTLLLFIVIILSHSYSQNFEGRIVLDDDGYIAVQYRNTTGVNLPNTSTLITDFEFDIRWLKAQENGKTGDIKMICHCTGYPFEIIDGPIWPKLNLVWQFRKVYITEAFYPPNDWVVNEWETVFQLAFTLDDVNWHWLNGALEIGEKNWGNASQSNDPIIQQSGSAVNDIDVLNNGVSDLYIPTGIALVWIGGATNSDYDEHSWNFADNWEIACPEGSESNGIWSAPRFTDDCTIPAGRTYYPKYAATPDWESAGACNDLILKAGSEINWESPSSFNTINLDVYGDLYIQAESGNYGTVNIGKNAVINVGDSESGTGNLSNNGYINLSHADATLEINKDLVVTNSNGLVTLGEVTVYGLTDIQVEMGIVIKADETGVGSFINEGDINFDSKAGAMVETFISGTVGDYFMHFAGPTVLDSTNFYNGIGYSGVRLEQFNMTTLDTYTYEWDSQIDTTDHELYPWVNVYPFWHNVPVAKGLAISNWEEGTGTMEMVGKLITDEVSYNLQSFTNNNLELVSNPFSSAVDFEDLYYHGNNSDVIKGHYWIYDASTGNYYGGANGAENGMIQVGQGFFVEVNGDGGELVFNPSIRNHSKVAFREMNMNILKLNVSGGDEGYKDELTISFNDNATAGYDENLEAKKWNSFGFDATMIRSIADDGSELSVNALPTTSLNNPMTSIPIHFECGYDAEYTFNFNGMETFEYATSIWIEDMQTGIWNSVSETNPVVTFNGSPGDDKERFVLHFVGPTATQEVSAMKKNHAVHIYSSNDNIYIRNTANEIIKDITVFNILGQEIYRDHTPEQDINQITIQGTTAYYVVHVRTNQSLCSEKVFIYN